MEELEDIVLHEYEQPEDVYVRQVIEEHMRQVIEELEADRSNKNE